MRSSTLCSSLRRTTYTGQQDACRILNNRCDATRLAPGRAAPALKSASIWKAKRKAGAQREDPDDPATTAALARPRRGAVFVVIGI